jgi:hypothetical protein
MWEGFVHVLGRCALYVYSIYVHIVARLEKEKSVLRGEIVSSLVNKGPGMDGGVDGGDYSPGRDLNMNTL